MGVLRVQAFADMAWLEGLLMALTGLAVLRSQGASLLAGLGFGYCGMFSSLDVWALKL